MNSSIVFEGFFYMCPVMKSSITKRWNSKKNERARKKDLLNRRKRNFCMTVYRYMFLFFFLSSCLKWMLLTVTWLCIENNSFLSLRVVLAFPPLFFLFSILFKQKGRRTRRRWRLEIEKYTWHTHWLRSPLVVCPTVRRQKWKKYMNFSLSFSFHGPCCQSKGCQPDEERKRRRVQFLHLNSVPSMN